MRKPRSDAKLLNLPAPDQSAIAQWLLDGLPYHTVQQHILERFQIHCSAKVISRFFHQIVSPLLADQRAHLNDRAQALAQDRAAHPHTFENLLADKIETRLLQLAETGYLPDDPVQLLKILHQIRRRQLQEQKFQHQVKTEAREPQEQSAPAVPAQAPDSEAAAAAAIERRRAFFENLPQLLGLPAATDPNPTHHESRLTNQLPGTAESQPTLDDVSADASDEALTPNPLPVRQTPCSEPCHAVISEGGSPLPASPSTLLAPSSKLLSPCDPCGPQSLPPGPSECQPSVPHLKNIIPIPVKTAPSPI